jgi:hypothetical protein
MTEKTKEVFVMFNTQEQPVIVAAKTEQLQLVQLLFPHATIRRFVSEEHSSRIQAERIRELECKVRYLDGCINDFHRPEDGDNWVPAVRRAQQALEPKPFEPHEFAKHTPTGRVVRVELVEGGTAIVSEPFDRTDNALAHTVGVVRRCPPEGIRVRLVDLVRCES